MSFLVDDDAHETLQEALAFIDACSEDGTTDSADSSRLRGTSTSTSTSRSAKCTVMIDAGDLDEGEGGREAIPFSRAFGCQQHKQQLSAKQAARTKQLQKAAVHRSRAKKQAKKILLREELAQLETKLSELQNARRTESVLLQVHIQRDSDTSEEASTSDTGQAETEDGDDSSLATGVQSTSTAPFWFNLAVKQAQELRKSQSLNAKLKEAVSKQAKLARSLKAIFTRMSSQAFQYNNSLLTQETGVMTDLRLRVHQMHVEVDSLFAHPSWLQTAGSVGYSSRLKQDPAFGPVVELRMNILLRCGVREVGDALWRRTMETSALVRTSNYFFERRMLTKSSYQKCYSMILNTFEGSLELTGTSYVERFSGADHDSYIWASVIFSPNEGEVFREKGWMVASSSAARGNRVLPDASVSESLFRGYYEVFCDDSREDEETRSFHSKDQREFVLRTLGNCTRDYHQYMQNLMLDEFAGSEMSARFELLCGI